MRSKSQSSPTKNHSLDYSQAIFSCKVMKKLFIGTSNRYVYIFQDQIIINKELNRKKPDRIFILDKTERVIWKYNDSKDYKQLKGFTLHSQGESYDYIGDDITLISLKKILAKFIFQAKVQDEYEAEGVIGQGNYAVVLELRHLHSAKKYASKCIDKTKLENVEKGYESLKNEINIMRQITPGPKVVNLHEIYEGDNNIYLIMDLANGGSLYNEMKERKKLYSRKEIQIIMKNIFEGLNYIHQFGIMHRDLKPENILFKEKQDYNTLRIADFGLSAFCNQVPYLYPKCGTPGFVAPEVANLVDKAKQYDHKCDIFSAGVILHILLFGEGLFAGKGHTHILKLNKECLIDKNQKKYLKLDSDVYDLLFKMIEKDPLIRLSAQECLHHQYFFNETPPPQPMTISPEQNNSNPPPFVYFKCEESSELKTPNKLIKNPKVEDSPSPNKDLNSLVTHTPIYNFEKRKSGQFDNGQKVSYLSLDKLEKGQKLDTINDDDEQEYIEEECKSCQFERKIEIKKQKEKQQQENEQRCNIFLKPIPVRKSSCLNHCEQPQKMMDKNNQE